jgi:hypothetical protein
MNRTGAFPEPPARHATFRVLQRTCRALERAVTIQQLGSALADGAGGLVPPDGPGKPCGAAGRER